MSFKILTVVNLGDTAHVLSFNHSFSHYPGKAIAVFMVKNTQRSIFKERKRPASAFRVGDGPEPDRRKGTARRASGSV